MADKEIVVDHKDIRDPQRITQVVDKAFRERGLDMHKNECSDMVDDHKAGKRIYKLKSRTFFDMGRRSR